jgi:hypothetical protein
MLQQRLKIALSPEQLAKKHPAELAVHIPMGSDPSYIN